MLSREEYEAQINRVGGELPMTNKPKHMPPVRPNQNKPFGSHKFGRGFQGNKPVPPPAKPK